MVTEFGNYTYTSQLLQGIPRDCPISVSSYDVEAAALKTTLSIIKSWKPSYQVKTFFDVTNISI